MTLKGHWIAVYGYTDDIGTQTYNLQLSQRRARAVRDFLVQTGIPATTITSAKGFGKSDPRVPGDSEQARAANRRVGRHSGFQTYHGRRSRRTEVNWAVQVRCGQSRAGPRQECPPNVLECLPREPRYVNDSQRRPTLP